MKIQIVTIPLRDAPNYGIPYGPLSLINHVRKNGYEDIELYHIDHQRPPYEDVLNRIIDTKPEILGISAIVSTSYEYTKLLSLDIKRLLPETLIVVGGNMAASAEIILRRTGADICVIGEGEKSFLNVIKRSERTHEVSQFMDIKGLALLDGDKFVNTGYETALMADEIFKIDYEDLERFTETEKIFRKVFDGDSPLFEWIANDPRSFQEHRRNKTMGHIACVKGCVARCTFCHRWDKGVRHMPVENIMAELDHHIKKYNVGFVMIFAETFGNDKRWLKEFCEEIKKRDILWWSGGLRANAAAATPEWISIMKDAGCACLTYGNETGSAKMLQIMEKKVTIDDNYNSMKWTIEAGIHTGIQLVLGMPGETSDTIRETIDYCKFVTTLSPEKNPNYISCNYAQALPGTPLYEYGRHSGLIGKDIDSEEQYLLMISNRNARDETTTLNFTDEPTLIYRAWRARISIEVNHHFVKTFGIRQYLKVLCDDKDFLNIIDAQIGTSAIFDATTKAAVPGIFSLLIRRRFGLAAMSYPVLFYHLRGLLPLMVLINTANREGTKRAAKLLVEYIIHKAKSLISFDKFSHEYKSLRKIVSKDLGRLATDSPETQPLRDGR